MAKFLLAIWLLLLAIPALADDKVYRAGEDGVQAPTLTYNPQPRYTEDARNAHIEGTVLVSMEVAPEGRAENITIVKSLDPGLDQNTIDAIRQWKFNPGTKDGKPVRVQAKVEVNFRLNYP